MTEPIIEGENREGDGATRDGSALSTAYFYAIVLIVFTADQLSKLWATRTLTLEQPLWLVPQSFGLTLTRNTGGAWGLLPNRNGVFIAFAFLAIAALLYAYHRMRHVDLLVGAAFALAMGGALGNLLDRVRLHYVVDFFEARFIHWPIFNVADSAISLGIVLLLVHFIAMWRADAVAHRETDRASETV